MATASQSQHQVQYNMVKKQRKWAGLKELPF